MTDENFTDEDLISYFRVLERQAAGIDLKRSKEIIRRISLQLADNLFTCLETIAEKARSIEYNHLDFRIGAGKAAMEAIADYSSLMKKHVASPAPSRRVERGLELLDRIEAQYKSLGHPAGRVEELRNIYKVVSERAGKPSDNGRLPIEVTGKDFEKQCYEHVVKTGSKSVEQCIQELYPNGLRIIPNPPKEK